MVAFQSEVVEIPSGEPILGCTEFPSVPHVEIVIDIPQAVFDQAIHQLRMSEPIPLPRFLQQIGCAGHVFHAAGHDDSGIAEGNGLRGHDQGLEAGPTDLVDRRGTNRVGDSGSDRGLSGRRLAEPGAEDAAHIHVFHTLFRNVNALQCFRYGDAA